MCVSMSMKACKHYIAGNSPPIIIKLGIPTWVNLVKQQVNFKDEL